VVDVFIRHEATIGSRLLDKGLISNEVLKELAPDLTALGFLVEAGKTTLAKIPRPVFFEENGIPALTYEVDAYHETCRCGFEIEAGRATQGNAIFRDLIQAAVMVQVDTLVLAIPTTYKYKEEGKEKTSKDYEKTISIAETIYSHSRFRLPYRLVVLGY
jgi:hypothetical protein